MIKTLLDAIDDDDLAAVARVWREAMNAERTYWIDQGKDPKTGRAKGYWAHEPDHKTRIAAANMVAAYREGLPVQRQIQLNANVEDLGETLKKLRSSPEAQRAIELLRGMGVQVPTLVQQTPGEKPVGDAREVPEESGIQHSDDLSTNVQRLLTRYKSAQLLKAPTVRPRAVRLKSNRFQTPKSKEKTLTSLRRLGICW